MKGLLLPLLAHLHVQEGVSNHQKHTGKWPDPDEGFNRDEQMEGNSRDVSIESSHEAERYSRGTYSSVRILRP